MEKMKPIDKKILKLIQEENLCVPRVTKIAHKLGLPTSTVHERLNKMKKFGVIKGYTAILDPEKLDKGFVAFVFGQMKLGEKSDLEAAAGKLAKIPEVQEVYFIAGEWDYIVKLRVKDKNEYYKKVQEVVKCFEVRGQGIITIKHIKDTFKFPIE